MASALRTVAHDDRLSLVEHLTELRVRIVICLAAFVATTALCFWQNQRVLDILNRPLTRRSSRQHRPDQVGAGYDQASRGCADNRAVVSRRAAALTEDAQARSCTSSPRHDKLAARRPEIRRAGRSRWAYRAVHADAEGAAYAGLLLSLPLILFQLYAFVLPAFSPREKQVALPAMLAVPFLFIGGVVFGYYTVVPRAIEFLQNFNTDAFDVLIQAQPYYKFVLMLLIAMGLLFQIPIGIVAVTRVANPRVHATTRRVVNEAFAEEKPHLRPLPLAPFRSVLRLERRISRDGMVSVGGNFYSVPDATRRRVVEVHTLAEEVRIFEDGALLAAHPVLEGRHQRRVLPGHRKGIVAACRRARGRVVPIARTGEVVAQRPLEFYDAVARRLARESRA